MLRQRVLKSWQSYKEKAISFQKAVKLLSEHTDKTVLPNFPLGINTCRQKLDSWTSYELSDKVQQEKVSLWKIQESLTDEHLLNLSLFSLNTLDMFKDLTQGWKKEKDSYARFKQNISNSGLTIEEVDDW